MRYLAALLLVAAPLGAQAPAMTPAPSRLFATTSFDPIGTSDSVGAVRSTPKGAIIGFLVGAGLGYSVVAMAQGGGCETVDLAGGGGGGSDPCGGGATMPRVVGAIVGALVGVVIGSKLSGPDAPSPQ